MSDNHEKTFVRGLGFGGVATDANAAFIDLADNKIIRIRPLHYDWKYPPEQFNPWQIKARGKLFQPKMKSLLPPYSLSYKKRIYSPNRVLYPMKRVDWDPQGERNPQNRGKSKYVRISWDEALDIIAAEVKRMYATYGPYAILSMSDGHGESKVIHAAHGCNRKLLNLLGGYTLSVRNTDSWEGWYWGAKHVWGMEPVGQGPQVNLIPDIAKNTELLLFWGCDPETTSWGWGGQTASRLCYWFKDLGIKSIYICPDLNYGAAVHADKWIPILPNTDAALQLAIAYTWLIDNTYDHEYVKTHTFGFDEFKDYVLGKEDGIAKTPKWASEKTGVAPHIIRALAKQWATKRTTIAHGNGGPYIRSAYSTEPARLEILLLAMQGVGKAGVNSVKMQEWGLFDTQEQYPMPRGKVLPNLKQADRGEFAAGRSAPGQEVSFVPKQFIPKDLVHKALLNPPLNWYGITNIQDSAEGQFKQYHYPAEGCPQIHMIWSDSPSMITCWNDSNSFIAGLRSPKVEFFMAQHPWLENDCMFADIILPSCTEFELEDIAVDPWSGQFNTVIHEKQCIKPLGESKSDYEIVCMIADRLGLLSEYTSDLSIEDLLKLGFTTSGVADDVSYEEWKRNGYYVVPTDPDWEQYSPGMRKFYEHPEDNRLCTPSGKIEFYAQNLARHFPDDPERPPVPHWIEKGESHDERLSSERAKTYPLLIMSNHGRWRVHSQHDDITWLREISTCKIRGKDGYQYEPLWINPQDAAKRGIKSGDVVKVFNERGAVMAGALVHERIMPGVIYMDHGARYDPVVPGELDRGGAINTITPRNTTSKNATGMVVSGFLVEVQLCDIDQLQRQYPDVFSRPYDEAAGLRRERMCPAEG